VRPILHFDGAPDRFSRTKALFATTSTLQVRYPAPDENRLTLKADAKGNPVVRSWRLFWRKAA
jgi:hypothetical protein